jgi:multidrug efflux pump subunit AcrA (membrane-fusion protein)
MTQKLSELFDLPTVDDSTVESAEHSIEENREMIEAVDLAIDKIDAALPFVSDLDTSDQELDELSKLAQDKFQDLIDLGMNVEARFSGHILATAGTLLGHAITAKQAKLDKKLKMVDLQLKKARLDMQIKQAEDKGQADGNKLLDAEDGQGVVLDRNELLRQILGQTSNK